MHIWPSHLCIVFNMWVLIEAQLACIPEEMLIYLFFQFFSFLVNNILLLFTIFYFNIVVSRMIFFFSRWSMWFVMYIWLNFWYVVFNICLFTINPAVFSSFCSWRRAPSPMWAYQTGSFSSALIGHLECRSTLNHADHNHLSDECVGVTCSASWWWLDNTWWRSLLDQNTIKLAGSFLIQSADLLFDSS